MIIGDFMALFGNVRLPDCKLQSVGKPVFHSHDMLKRYLVNHFQGNELIEYRTEADLRRGHVHKISQMKLNCRFIYKMRLSNMLIEIEKVSYLYLRSKTDNQLFRYHLPHVFDGTNHMLFNGSLFFHRAGFPRITKYELSTGHHEDIEVEGAAHKGDNVDINNLTIYEIHNLTLVNHTQIANGIVICGVLYVVEDAHQQSSYISLAYDFYRLQYSKPNIKWINLYRNTNMVSYNPYDKRIYVYDHGYLLTVPAHLQWLAK
uniref:Olfactomedin-like domain-containing protein n=1 Tax=Heterorhabditis bacteriophora TaxID=37862 RepID=A0A1I7WVK9_HETBA